MQIGVSFFGGFRAPVFGFAETPKPRSNETFTPIPKKFDQERLGESLKEY